jgi:hypothetical protein
MRRALPSLAAVILVPTIASGAEPPRHAVELGAELSLARMVAPAGPIGEIDRTNGGLGYSFSAAYRSPYPLSPFVELTYVPLFAADASTREGSIIRSRSRLFGGALGLGLSIVDGVRLRAGLGLFDFGVTSTLGSATADAHELDMGYLLGLSATLLERGRVRVGFDFRAGLVTDAETAFLSLGIVTTFDALTWGTSPPSPTRSAARSPGVEGGAARVP